MFSKCPFRLFDQGTLIDPYPVYAEMRRSAPVYQSPDLKGWVFTRYEDVAYVLSNFPASEGALLESWRPGDDQPRHRDMFEEISTLFASWLSCCEGKKHRHLRSMVAGGFKASMIEAARPAVRRKVADRIAVLPGSGSMDFLADFAWPVTITCLSDLLGFPHRHRHKIRDWCRLMSPFLQSRPHDSGEIEAMHTACREIKASLGEVFKTCRERPGTDIIGRLVTAGKDGDCLQEIELQSICSMLLFAGYKSTAANLAIGLYSLLRFPDQCDLLRAEPSLIEPAVEELLRFESSAHYMARQALERTEIAGTAIPRGAFLFPCIAAANRDPAQFVDPDRLAIKRSTNAHLTFGKGRHFCIGAPLARMVIQETLAAVLVEYPNLELHEPVVWDLHLNSRAPLAVRIRYDRQGKPSGNSS